MKKLFLVFFMLVAFSFISLSVHAENHDVNPEHSHVEVSNEESGCTSCGGYTLGVYDEWGNIFYYCPKCKIYIY